jgi:outer membrane lipoprotein SlyB
MVRSGSLILLMLGALQAAAFAETVEGRVSQADPYTLDMVIYDDQGRPYPNALRLKVDGSTHLSGFRSVSDLRPNAPVSAEVRQEESGVWRADSVTLFQRVDMQPATQKPSPSLRDTLGNPVVRGALTGAVTGAIASSASGGKAGKGALVGAGVGAAAGLLGGMFSQPSQNSSDDDNR